MRLDEKVANEAESAWKSAAKDAAAAWKSAIGGIPGLPGVTGASPITQTQLDMAAQGLPVNFADNFTRRMNDELINGVDYPEITRELVEKIVSSTRNLSTDQLSGVSNELLAGMASEDISSGAALGTGFGQSIVDLLIDKDALVDSARTQGLVTIGKAFVESYVEDVLGSEGFDFSNTVNPLTDAIINGVSESGVAAKTTTELSSQFSQDNIVNSMQGIGKSVAENLFAGFDGSISETSWAQAIIASIMDSLSGAIEAAASGG